MRCYEFKGGSGTASRVVDYAGRPYSVGAFVQSNFGKRHLLMIAGIPVGQEIPVDNTPAEAGSIIVVVATDAPMLPHQLKRVARRAAYGIARSGGIASNESGDLFLAFSTANRAAVDTHEATIDAVDEAIMNSIFANETMIGRDRHQVPGLPIATIQSILRRHNRLLQD